MTTLDINATTREVYFDGTPVSFGARAFDVLAYLNAHSERVVTKIELLDAVWGGMTVEEGNLTVQISALRKSLGPKAISTVPGVGYKLALGCNDSKVADEPSVLEEPASIAVLPFSAWANDAELAYLAEAVARDLTAELTRIKSLVVRTSHIGQRAGHDTTDEAAASGGRFNTRYLVDGAIQKAGTALRITVQLIEAETARSLWSERFSGNMDDLFALQDRVVEAVSAAIEPSIVFVEAERVGAKTTDLEAQDLCLQATPMVFRLGSRDQALAAQALLDQAIAMAPGYIVAKGLLCRLLSWSCGARFISFEAARACLPIAESVLAAPEADPLSMIFAAHALAYLDNKRDQRARGASVAKRAYGLSPNSSILLASAGWLHNYAGEPTDAITFFQRSLRLNPLDPYVGQTRSGLGTAFCMAGDWETGIEVLEQAYTEAPEFGTTVQNLAVAHWLAGDRERSKTLRDELLARPAVTKVSAYETVSPFRGLPFNKRVVQAMREMDMPE